MIQPSEAARPVKGAAPLLYTVWGILGCGGIQAAAVSARICYNSAKRLCAGRSPHQPTEYPAPSNMIWRTPARVSVWGGVERVIVKLPALSMEAEEVR